MIIHSEVKTCEVDETELTNSARFVEEWHCTTEHAKKLASEQQEAILLRTGVAGGEATGEMGGEVPSAFTVAPSARQFGRSGAYQYECARQI